MSETSKVKEDFTIVVTALEGDREGEYGARFRIAGASQDWNKEEFRVIRTLKEALCLALGSAIAFRGLEGDDIREFRDQQLKDIFVRIEGHRQKALEYKMTHTKYSLLKPKNVN